MSTHKRALGADDDFAPDIRRIAQLISYDTPVKEIREKFPRLSVEQFYLKYQAAKIYAKDHGLTGPVDAISAFAYAGLAAVVGVIGWVAWKTYKATAPVAGLGYVDLIPGGRASGRRPEDFDPHQLALGIRTELEHTRDWRLAREIAMDHLTEYPDYYTRLRRAGL